VRELVHVGTVSVGEGGGGEDGVGGRGRWVGAGRFARAFAGGGGGGGRVVCAEVEEREDFLALQLAGSGGAGEWCADLNGGGGPETGGKLGIPTLRRHGSDGRSRSDPFQSGGVREGGAECAGRMKPHTVLLPASGCVVWEVGVAGVRGVNSVPVHADAFHDVVSSAVMGGSCGSWVKATEVEAVNVEQEAADAGKLVECKGSGGRRRCGRGTEGREAEAYEVLSTCRAHI